MKVFVTGARGLLGHELRKSLAERGHDCIASGSVPPEEADIAGSYVSLDLKDREAVLRALEGSGAEALIHCAAWTNVESAEAAENLAAVRALNVDSTENLALACGKLGLKMLYLSTDYVFNGRGDQPYRPEDGDLGPLNVYGRTKLEGEQVLRENLDSFFILRTSWMFGINGGNFVRSIINAGKKHKEVYVVDDQIGRPTYARDLARLVCEMIESRSYGCYHATNEGEYISWYDFAREIFLQAGLKSRVVPIPTEVYTCTKAKRPSNSRLDTSCLKENGFSPLPPWKDALSRYLKEIADAI